MNRRLAAVLLLAAACAKKLDGPTPTLASASPDLVCNAQLATAVTLSGSGLAVMMQGALKDGRLLLPTVTLVPLTTLAGAAAGGPSIVIPDDPANPSASKVRWLSQSELAFTVDPALALPAGVYDVVVQNADAQVARLPASFGAVPPPRLDAVAPAAVCSQATIPVVLTGADFLVLKGVAPTVRIGDRTYASTASQCTPIAGFPDAQLCTQLTVQVNGADFTVGQGYAVVVTNPPPANCASAEGTLRIAPPPTLAQVTPPQICATGGTLNLAGTGFEPGAAVTIDGAAAGGGDAGATSVTVTTDGTGATAVFQNAGAQAMVPSATPYPVTLHDPSGCSATLPAAVKVKPAPQLFFVDPPVVFNGIVTQATVYGTNIAQPVQQVKLALQGGTATLSFSACGTGGTAPCFTTDPARPNQIQILIPATSAALPVPPGTWDLAITDSTAGCANATLASALQVTATTTLTLASPAVDPSFGWTGAATGVTVSAAAGSTFGQVPRVYLSPVLASATTVASALGAVQLVSASQLSAVVPAGLPAGAYDLVVVNPDGTVGVASSAFTVTPLASPPPVITALSPGQLSTSGTPPFLVIGRNLRPRAAAAQAVAFDCFDTMGASLGAVVTASAVSCASPQQCSVQAALSGSTPAVFACNVRWTNDDGTFASYSALSFTNPSANIAGPVSGAGGAPVLASTQAARRAPVVLGGNATPAARFLHVIGGDDGTGAALATVESSPIAPSTSTSARVGQPTGFAPQVTMLQQARTLAGGALVSFQGSRPYLYVAGGSQAGAGGARVRLTSVERAAVLSPDDRGAVTDLGLDVDAGGGVGPGLWYYRVAAVLGAADPVNPGGEDLPSDPFPVKLPDITGGLAGGPRIDVTVQWQRVPGASSYRIYRSPTRVDAAGGPAVGQEMVIGVVTEADAAAAGYRFKDAGVAAPAGTGTPLPIGSLGAWSKVADLATAREGAGVAFGLDPVAPATKGYLYVIGGRTGAATASVLASYELLTVTVDPATGIQAVSGPTAGAVSLSVPRWQLGAASATRDTSPKITSGTVLWMLGGLGAGGTGVSTVEGAVVLANGQLSGSAGAGGTTPVAFDVLASNGQTDAGYVAAVAGDLVFAFGGEKGSTSSAKVVSGAMTTPPFVANFNANPPGLSTPRYLAGGAAAGSFVYVANGCGDATLTSPDACGQPSRTVEYFIW